MADSDAPGGSVGDDEEAPAAPVEPGDDRIGTGEPPEDDPYPPVDTEDE